MAAEHCPVCLAPDLQPFLRRADVPVNQNYVCPSGEAARALPRGQLDLICCQACGFIFNQAFDPAMPLYGEAYDNAQGLSPAFHRHEEALLDRLAGDVEGRRIVEVGCGQGRFLRRLVERTGPATLGWGFDPSYRGPDVDLDGRLHFARDYYGPESATIAGDVVVCRHVIEHVPDPVALLTAVRGALTPGARLFFETPCVRWILDNEVIWDLFYEHCSYFSAASLTTAFTRAGFEVLDVRHVFDGQYLWLEARLPEMAPAMLRRPGDLPDSARRYARTEAAQRTAWAILLQDRARQGRTALWGAGAKGATLANLADPEGKWLDCLVDINPVKQGHYLPGTGHPIVAPEALGARGIDAAILTNPAYRGEIAAWIREHHLDIELIGSPP